MSQPTMIETLRQQAAANGFTLVASYDERTGDLVWQACHPSGHKTSAFDSQDDAVVAACQLLLRRKFI